ncbi:hypothetical protein Aperf_G00000062037 [Anoplocephala perfoliata]
MSLQAWHKLQSEIPQKVTGWHLNELSDCFDMLSHSYRLQEDIAQQHQCLVKRLVSVFQHLHPDVQVQIFGSCMNGFGTKTSDLDVSVNFPADSAIAECFARGSCSEQKEELKKLDRILYENKRYLRIKNIRRICGARVKIIKFCLMWKGKDIEVDVSFSNDLAVCNTHLLREYNDYEPRLRTLNVVLKEIRQTCQLRASSEGGISSYAFAVMLIHYLQQKGYLPCLQEAYESDIKPQIMVNDWNVWFQTDRGVVHRIWSPPKESTTVAEMWFGFLRYYLFEFDRETYCIRIDTKSLTRKNCPDKLFTIMDPFIETRDLADNVKAREIFRILTMFYHALLHHITCERNGMKVDKWIGNVVFSASKLGRQLEAVSFVNKKTDDDEEHHR